MNYQPINFEYPNPSNEQRLLPFIGGAIIGGIGGAAIANNRMGMGPTAYSYPVYPVYYAPQYYPYGPYMGSGNYYGGMYTIPTNTTMATPVNPTQTI